MTYGVEVPPAGASDCPLVSIVTPSYNQGQYLEETILSVLGQDYPSIEYLVLDGGSTDGSLEVIRRYESKLAYWVSEPDRGQTHAINKGWARAHGEILAYLNSDDLYLPGAVSAAVSYMQARPDVDLVYGSADAWFTNADGSTTSVRLNPPDFDMVLLARSDFIPQPTVFLRRRVLERLGPLDESFHYCMDYDFWVRAGRTSSIGRMSACTAVTRYHQDSKSCSQAVGFLHEELRIFDRLAAGGSPDERHLARQKYLFRLLPILGSEGEHGHRARTEALHRLASLRPRPTVEELAGVIAWHDNAFHSRFRAYTVNPTPVEGAKSVADGHGAVTPMIASGILTRSEGRVLARRVAARANLRNMALGFPGISPLRALASVLVAREPAPLARRWWWRYVLLRNPIGRSLYQIVRGREARVNGPNWGERSL